MDCIDEQQVESPTKLKEEERVVVKSDIAKALKEHFNAYNVLAKQHFAEDSGDSEAEDIDMETDSLPSSSKPESEETGSLSEPEVSADETSNLQLAWEMLELAKVR